MAFSVRNDRQWEAEEAQDEYDFHHEKYGWYCRYCGAGEFDSKSARKRHEGRCWKNPEAQKEREELE